MGGAVFPLCYLPGGKHLASLVAQKVKHLPTMRETGVRFLSQEDPLKKEMTIHSSTLAWKIPWTEKPDRLQSMGLQRVGHDWATSLSFPKLPGGNEDKVYPLQKVPFRPCYTPCPQPCSRPSPTHASAGDSWTLTGKSGSVFCGVTTLFSWVLVCIRFYPVLCKVWQLYGRVNGDLFPGGLWHTQVCCTQGPCPCGSPLLTCISTGDVQTQFCLSLCGVSGSWCAQLLFEPSECLWQVWGLILNVILPLLLSCWGFSFALRCGVSPHSRSSAEQP